MLSREVLTTPFRTFNRSPEGEGIAYHAFVAFTTQTSVDDVLDAAYEREKSFKNFLEGLQIGGTVAGDFDRVITGAYFPAASAFQGSQILASTAELYPTLSASEKDQLRDHYFAKLNSIKSEFRSVCSEFEEQLR